MVTYLTKFCKQLSDLARPVRHLLKDNVKWQSEEQQREAFNQMKLGFVRLPVLRLYDPNQPNSLRRCIFNWSWSSADARGSASGVRVGNPYNEVILLVTPWGARYDLTQIEGLTVKGERFVIPETLRNVVLKLIHEGHLGESKCIERAKLSVCWPGIDEHVRDVVTRSKTCQENCHHNPLLPTHLTDIPRVPNSHYPRYMAIHTFERWYGKTSRWV